MLKAHYISCILSKVTNIRSTSIYIRLSWILNMLRQRWINNLFWNEKVFLFGLINIWYLIIHILVSRFLPYYFFDNNIFIWLIIAYSYSRLQSLYDDFFSLPMSLETLNMSSKLLFEDFMQSMNLGQDCNIK